LTKITTLAKTPRDINVDLDSFLSWTNFFGWTKEIGHFLQHRVSIFY